MLKILKKNRKRKSTGSRKSREKNQTEEHTVTGNLGLRILRPRLQDRDYVIPDSEDEDMEQNSEEIQQDYLCTSVDPTRIGTGEGETIILRPKELHKVITF